MELCRLFQMQTTLPSNVHGGEGDGPPFFPIHQPPIVPSFFLILPQHLHCSAVSKPLLLRSLCPCRSVRWNSNAETFRTRNFSLNEEDEDDEEREDRILDCLDEFIDSIWILKVFKPYCWALPPIILSSLLANGLVAFIMTLALLLGQSVFVFALQKLWVVTQTNLGYKNKKMGGGRRRRRNPSTREGKMGHPDVPAGRLDKDVPIFGGWDELDQVMDYNMLDSSISLPPKTQVEKGKLSESKRQNTSSIFSLFPWSKRL